MWKLKNFQSSIENVFGSYSDAEILVREATNEEPWGPSGTQMKRIEMLCYREPEFSEIMNMLWFRMMTEPTKSWRRVYKCLKVMDNLIRNGPTKVVDSVVENINYLNKVRRFKYIDEDNKDQTNNIVHRAKEIESLVGDFPRLRYERKCAKELREKLNSGSIASQYYDEKPKDSTIADKTRGIINSIVEKVSGSQQKSFYETGKVMMMNPYRSYSTNNKAYKDETDDETDVRFKTESSPVNEKNATSNTETEKDEFGQFFGATETPSNNKLLAMELKSDNVPVDSCQAHKSNDLLELFSENPSLPKSGTNQFNASMGSDFQQLQNCQFVQQNQNSQFSPGTNPQTQHRQFIAQNQQPQNLPSTLQNPNFAGQNFNFNSINSQFQNLQLTGQVQPQNSNFMGQSQPQNTNFMGQSQPQNTNFMGQSQPQNANFMGQGQPQNAIFMGQGQLQNASFMGQGQPQNANFMGQGQPQNVSFVGQNQQFQVSGQHVSSGHTTQIPSSNQYGFQSTSEYQNKNLGGGQHSSNVKLTPYQIAQQNRNEKSKDLSADDLISKNLTGFFSSETPFKQ